MYDRRTGAFTLVEMMVVVAIMGVLVTLALPHFRTFIARARQAEAKINLGHIKKLQQSYTLRWQGLGQDDVRYTGDLGGNGTQQDTCQDRHRKNALGFRLEDCEKARYTYNATRGEEHWSFGVAWNNGSSSHTIYPNCTGEEDTMHMCRSGQGACNTARAGDLVIVSDTVATCAD